MRGLMRALVSLLIHAAVAAGLVLLARATVPGSWITLGALAVLLALVSWGADLLRHRRRRVS